MKTLMLIHILSLILISCGIERNDDGSKLFKFYYIDGTLKKTQLQKPNEGMGNGYWKFYDEEGYITKEVQRTDGEYCGLIKFYWQNGNLRCEETLINEKSSGNQISYYENGMIECWGKKKDGEFDGVWLYFSVTGDTVRKSLYKSGRLIDDESFN